MQKLLFITLFALLVVAPTFNEACNVSKIANGLVKGAQIAGAIGGALGRSDDNADFSTLPESIKQCVYRRSASDTNILKEVNKCSKQAGGVNCVKAIAGVASCFQ